MRTLLTATPEFPAGNTGVPRRKAFTRPARAAGHGPAAARWVLAAALTFALAGGAAPADAQQLAREQRDLVRPASDSLPRYPHGRRLGGPASSGRRFEEIRRLRAPEATQGVAASTDHLFATGNRIIAKYDKHTGERLAVWEGDADGPVIHLNSCIVHEARLVCAHSNHPGVPMLSSVETWDPATLEHTGSHSIGAYEGSLTWALPKDGDWWLHFAHYGNYSGTPGKGPEWSTLVRFDSAWSRIAGYAYPPDLIATMTPNSSSGGAWGPGGLLYVTGHDAPEVYVLRLPQMGSVLEWVDTLPAPMHGQAWTFDPADPEVVWGIVRSSGEIVAGRLGH